MPVTAIHRLVALVSSVLLVASACSGDDLADWCDDATTLVDAVSAYRNYDDFPPADSLRELVLSAVSVRDGAVNGAEPQGSSDFVELASVVKGLERTLSAYDWDLLRAQSESDSEQQDDLFAVDGIPASDALGAATEHIAARCQAS